MALVADAARLRLALTPLRRQLLHRLREPASATMLAAELDLPRQRVGYHLRTLEQAGLLELVEERPRRGCTERIVRAAADSFLVDPDVMSHRPTASAIASSAPAVPGPVPTVPGPALTARGPTPTVPGPAPSATDLASQAGEAQAPGRRRPPGRHAGDVPSGGLPPADAYAAGRLVAAAAETVRQVARMKSRAADDGVRLLTFTVEAAVRFAEPDDVHRFTDALYEAIRAVVAEFDTPAGRPYRLIAGGHPAPITPTPRPDRRDR